MTRASCPLAHRQEGIMERANQGEHREREKSNQTKQMRVDSLEGQLEEKAEE